jgi:hypothetical protein
LTYIFNKLNSFKCLNWVNFNTIIISVLEKKSIGEIIFEGKKSIQLKKLYWVGILRLYNSLKISPNGNLLCGSYESIIILDKNSQKIKSIKSTRLSLRACIDNELLIFHFIVFIAFLNQLFCFV